LTSENKIVKESIQIPISTMVKIANQTLENYVDTMDEQSKKTFIEILKSDGDSLKEDFSVLKEKTIEKLNSILGEQKESDVIEKISETIDKLKGEEFNQINYFKLVNLEKNL
jgi:HJR/Mrr/RecB family endonuclease